MELEESGFFGQMLVQFRMAGLASNIRLHKNRFLSILSDGAEKLVSSGAIENLRDAGTLDSRSLGFYAALGEVTSRRDELKLRAESLEDDQSMVRSTLEQYAASDNPSRRIDDLRFRIKETDKRIDALVILSAREYCDKFIDDDGISVLGGGAEGHSFGDMGAYSRYLEDVAHLRSEVSEIRGKIEILETKLKIETIERNIAVWERSCGEAERKIAMLQEQIVKLGKNIDEAGIERGRLADHLENLEKTL
jgi:chromosome segregation ATPase